MVYKIVTRSLSVLSRGHFTSHSGVNYPFLTKTWMSTEDSPSSDDGKKLAKTEMISVPKLLFGKKALMKLRKKTGFSMTQCRKALLKHDLDLDAALEYLKRQIDSEEESAIAAPEIGSKEAAAVDDETVPCERASIKDETAKKKKKPKLKGGVITARLSKEATMLLEMNCQSVTLTRNEEFHDLVDSVANIVFENADSLVHELKLRASGSTAHITVDGVGTIAKTSLNASNILPLRGRRGGGGGGGGGKEVSVRSLVAEGKAKLGEALSPKRCVIFAACSPKDEDSHTATPAPDSTAPPSSSPSPPSSSSPSPPPPPRFHFGFYLHPSSARSASGRLLNGRYGAVVALAVNERHFNHVEIGRRLAQHVVGMNPSSVGGGGAKDDDFCEPRTTETRFVEQKFLSDPSLRIKEYLFMNGTKVVDFVRFECGKK